MYKKIGNSTFGQNGYGDIGVNPFNYPLKANRHWNIVKPFNEFEYAIMYLLNNRTLPASTRYTSIILVDKNGISKIGSIDSVEATININDMNDVIYQQVINGNYNFYDPLGDSILINLDEDAVVFDLDPISMDELQKKSLLPIRINFDNKFIRLSNEDLDVYMISGGDYKKLSDEAGKEIIELYNKQYKRLNAEGDE